MRRAGGSATSFASRAGELRGAARAAAAHDHPDDSGQQEDRGEKRECEQRQRAVEDRAALHRHLHVDGRAPVDQTLRGGTQTEGNLLARREPEIARLRAVLNDAVAHYIAQLPPPDPAHPLLRRPREGFGFAGSWSVRLQGAGFHVNHVHTTGWISSACYLAVPDSLGDGPGDTAGWLAFGAPPAELGLRVEPFHRIAPRPGRLVLFPSTVWHGTEPFAAGERLTVAFDVISKS